MSDCASKLSAKLDGEYNIEPQLLVMAELVLEERVKVWLKVP